LVLQADRLSQRVIRSVRDALLDGRWGPGDRLPSEKVLAEQLGVGRNVVREAIKALESLGLVEVRRGASGGTFVRQASSRQLNDALYTVLRLEGFELRHLHEARLLLEPGVAALAAERSTPLGLADLERSVAHAEAAAAQGGPMGQAVDLHAGIARMSGNPILELLVGLLTDLLDTSRVRHPSPIDRDAAAAERLVRHHQTIVAAIGSRDVPGSREAMRVHLEDVSNVERSHA
jgi:GntR family transcriptional regulator, transcriptional repressor for pyruvate dehydrogenase complex